MSAISQIEWTDRTWNPVRGCSVVSPGCVNCYAMKQAHRFNWAKPADTEVDGIGSEGPYFGLTKPTSSGPQWTGKIRLVEEALLEPLSWRKPARVFVNSMSDLFHDGVPDEFIAHVFAVMALSPWHTFQILTKRPERMLRLLDDYDFRCEVEAWIAMNLENENRPAVLRWDALGRRTDDARATAPDVAGEDWPLENVWAGTSVENQDTLRRIDVLKDTSAAVRFVSFEPLLQDLGAVILDGVHWAIVGGESGPRARPCGMEWIQSIVRQCKAASVPVFVKQVGSQPVWIWNEVERHDVGLRDRKGGDMSEWPEDLRVREYPIERTWPQP